MSIGQPVIGLAVAANSAIVVHVGFVPVAGTACSADFDADGDLGVPDIFAFLTAWFNGEPAAYSFGGTPGVPAIFAFLTAWFAGCP